MPSCAVTFCDGKVVGAVLDRNGLRPARYWLTKDQRVIFASEVGVLPVDPANIERKGRLQPGRMFLVDIEQGQDPERKGVAVLIDVDDVVGLGAAGMFHQERPK